ncbi:MAG: hypothetical protein WC376_04825 [Candidatus Nanoarchaeia archaeon]|jgi:hypothetical protein
MFNVAKQSGLELCFYEMNTPGIMSFMSSEGTKKIELSCIGPIYDSSKTKVGELKNFYLTKDSANLQYLVIEKEFWNKGYASIVCEYLIKTYAIPNNLKKFIIEEIQTINDGIIYSGNLEKFKKVKDKLVKKGLAKSGEVIFNEKSRHNNIIIHL